MRDKFDQFAHHKAELLVISSTDLDMTSFVAEALRAPYKILSDPEWTVFERYGMGAVLGVPLPGVFILDEQGTVRYRWAAPASPSFRPPDTAAIIRELAAF